MEHLQTRQVLLCQIHLANDLNRHLFSAALQNAPFHRSVLSVPQHTPKIHNAVNLHIGRLQLREGNRVHICHCVVESIQQIIYIGDHVGIQQMRLTLLELLEKGGGTSPYFRFEYSTRPFE